MTSASVTRQEQQRSVFISTEHGEVEVPLTFGELVKDMLPPEAGEDVIREITRMCCEKCGQPEGCECVDDVIVSTSWRTSWTWEIGRAHV